MSHVEVPHSSAQCIASAVVESLPSLSRSVFAFSRIWTSITSRLRFDGVPLISKLFLEGLARRLTVIGERVVLVLQHVVDEWCGCMDGTLMQGRCDFSQTVDSKPSKVSRQSYQLSLVIAWCPVTHRGRSFVRISDSNFSKLSADFSDTRAWYTHLFACPCVYAVYAGCG